MPTQQTTYNSRITDEALEKKFRDSFRSQAGAELVNDLYASGVIVPVVDFTAASEGSALRQDLQKAWDSSTGSAQVSNTTSTLISNAGFWQVDLTGSIIVDGVDSRFLNIVIDDGSTTTRVWELFSRPGINNEAVISQSETFTVFLRSGDTLKATSNDTQSFLSVWYRQIADVYGNLENPTGYTSE